MVSPNRTAASPASILQDGGSREAATRMGNEHLECRGHRCGLTTAGHTYGLEVMARLVYLPRHPIDPRLSRVEIDCEVDMVNVQMPGYHHGEVRLGCYPLVVDVF